MPVGMETVLRLDGTTPVDEAAGKKGKARRELLTAVSKCENRLLEHKRKACDVYTKLSAEARPILMDNSMPLKGAVVDFLGSERLTQLAESRRQHRGSVVAEGAAALKANEAMVQYSICVGTVANVKCKESTPTDGVYVADREGKYGTSKFSGITDKYEVDVDTKAIPGISNLFEAKYISVIAHQVGEIEESIRAVFSSNRDMKVDFAMAAEVIAHLRDMASEGSEIVYARPAYTLPPYNTADYSVHVLSLSGTVTNLTNYVLNIHRTLVVSERTFVQGVGRHAIPLCEEVVVEFVPKDSVDTVRKHTLTPRSLVLTAVVSTDARGPKPASVLHYFGSNACTALLSNISQVHRDHKYASTHANGMYVAGWMVRQLANIGSEVSIHNTDIDVFSKFIRRDPQDDDHTERQRLRHTFLGRQGAQNLLDTDGKKLFYTKVWKATPTICVICISPLSNLSANSVFVWSIGSGFESTSRGGPVANDQMQRSRSLSRGAGARQPRPLENNEPTQAPPPPLGRRAWSDRSVGDPGGPPRRRGGAWGEQPFGAASMLSPELELELEML